MTPDAIDVAISFDTTGSMYPCLRQVRRVVSELVTRLFRDIPNLRVGIIAHGDYYDKRSTYVLTLLDLTDDVDRICDFVRNVGPTNGGDAPECYELVLNQARTMSWRSGKSKVLVVIGDDVPHGPSYRLNTENIDWRNELGLLMEAGVNVYGVHAMPGIRTHSRGFYEEIARKTGGFYLTLDQFHSVNDLILAVCYAQDGEEAINQFGNEVLSQGRMTANFSSVYRTLTGDDTFTSAEEVATPGLNPVPIGRFQLLHVDRDQAIKAFVEDNGATFNAGRGFYELTKTVVVQPYKELVLMDRSTGQFFNGSQVRTMLGLQAQREKGVGGENEKLYPRNHPTYRVFVQSTSYNRKLKSGTTFLYEISDWDMSAAA